jgi:kynurenine formamidase
MGRLSFAFGVVVVLALSHATPAQQPPAPPVKDASAYAHAPRTAEEFDQMMTSVSNWGRWGKEDQIGAVNLITPEKRKQAAALVRLGTAVSLAHDEGTRDARAPTTPNIRHTMMQPSEGGSVVVGSVALGDHSLSMTHLDALCHILYKGHTYNGFTLDEVYGAEGCKKAGLAYKDGIVTRGVLIDLPRLRGVPYLEPGTPVYTEDILAWEKKTGVKVAPGDVVILRTGRWPRLAQKGEWDIQSTNAGFHPSVAPFMKARGVVIVGQDGPDGVQPMSFPGVRYPFHTMMMVGLGIDILDQVNTEEVAAMAAKLNRYEFMITIAPLRVVGGTGVAVNPLAIF